MNEINEELFNMAANAYCDFVDEDDNTNLIWFYNDATKETKEKVVMCLKSFPYDLPDIINNRFKFIVNSKIMVVTDALLIMYIDQDYDGNLLNDFISFKSILGDDVFCPYVPFNSVDGKDSKPGYAWIGSSYDSNSLCSLLF